MKNKRDILFSNYKLLTPFDVGAGLPDEYHLSTNEDDIESPADCGHLESKVKFPIPDEKLDVSCPDCGFWE
jgi:hypothetical protein